MRPTPQIDIRATALTAHAAATAELAAQAAAQEEQLRHARRELLLDLIAQLLERELAAESLSLTDTTAPRATLPDGTTAELRIMDGRPHSGYLELRVPCSRCHSGYSGPHTVAVNDTARWITLGEKLANHEAHHDGFRGAAR